MSASDDTHRRAGAAPRLCLEPSASADGRTTRRGSDRTRFPPPPEATGGRGTRVRRSREEPSDADLRERRAAEFAGVDAPPRLVAACGCRARTNDFRILRGRAKTGAGAQIAAGAASARTCSRHQGRKINGWKIGRSGDVSVRDLLSERPQHARARYPVVARVSASGHAQAGPPPGTVRGRGELARLDESTRHRGRRLENRSGTPSSWRSRWLLRAPCGSAASSLSASSRRRTSRNSARSRSRRGCRR